MKTSSRIRDLVSERPGTKRSIIGPMMGVPRGTPFLMIQSEIRREVRKNCASKLPRYYFLSGRSCGPAEYECLLRGAQVASARLFRSPVHGDNSGCHTDVQCFKCELRGQFTGINRRSITARLRRIKRRAPCLNVGRLFVVCRVYAARACAKNFARKISS
jgi:hypothetical protein